MNNLKKKTNITLTAIYLITDTYISLYIKPFDTLTLFRL